MTEEDNESFISDGMICKSISGGEDENGNYVFEVEASNENLDLQNQVTLQSALEKSQEYFITNGVISDDHLHKTRNPDGSVESHKDKIIGEPISVRFDKNTKKTFVKGLLYKGIESAKPYIDLLKNKSKLVKASIGGIMPKIKHNNDGTETVTSFMWNDLALTCSPVNWTVGSARFAKSVSVIDFCKSLNAGSGADASTMTDGRSLQNEDMEKETEKILDMTDGDIKNANDTEDLEKSEVDDGEIIKNCVSYIASGNLKTEKEIQDYLVLNGFDDEKARETTLEIIKQGGNKVSKSNFSSAIDDLLKSFDGEKADKAEKDDKKKKLDSDDEPLEDSLFDDMDDDASDEDDEPEDKEVEKCSVKKSLDEEIEDDDQFMDATEVMKSMGDTMDELRAENDELRKSIEELQSNLLEVTKSVTGYLNTPEARKTVMQKSLDGNTQPVNGPAKRPSTADFDVLKSCLVKAVQKKELGLEAVQFYNSEFQKAMNGMKVNPDVWNKICSIVQENR